MQIPPISSRGSTDPYPTDWQNVCDQMQLRITRYLGSKQLDQLDGYLSTMIQFSQGFGDDTPQRAAFGKAIEQLYFDVGAGGNWQKDISTLRNLFPPDITPNDVMEGFVNILASNLQTMPGQSTADYISGLQTSLYDLIGFASDKDAQVLRSSELQDPMNAFIASPTQPNADAMNVAMKAAIYELE